ncbi:hypothetical protein DFH08DRAFT_939754 [Mycena albidolilacea]|uniref:Uncharacterized protein n=1 Tax=Mycena albidolilacea TaxID=1033008 RepID=A0AAD6ZRF8_9AGAR|nr:hypothetical protein DFH08DRAFT_939754 [Mycena albidolilacea]
MFSVAPITMPDAPVQIGENPHMLLHQTENRAQLDVSSSTDPLLSAIYVPRLEFKLVGTGTANAKGIIFSAQAGWYVGVRLRRRPSRKRPFSGNERAYPSVRYRQRTDPVYGREYGRSTGGDDRYVFDLERVQVTQFGNFVVTVDLRQFAGSEHCLYFEVKEVAHCYIFGRSILIRPHGMLQLEVLGQRPPNGLRDLGILHAYSDMYALYTIRRPVYGRIWIPFKRVNPFRSRRQERIGVLGARGGYWWDDDIPVPRDVRGVAHANFAAHERLRRGMAELATDMRIRSVPLLDPATSCYMTVKTVCEGQRWDVRAMSTIGGTRQHITSQ